ncbi:MAG: cysteine desulfurase [Bacteroidales bacterium]|nr:cysteine desulfurase [Bacteroidales bacterium]
MIYLDSAATTQPKQRVIDAMMPYINMKWYNPSALYSKAKTIKEDINTARKTIADYINADANEIYFTSSGSESNCWAIQGFVNRCIAKGKNPCVITSVIEHKSIIECVDNLSNVDVHYIGVDKEGFINIDNLRNVLFHAKYICNKDILVSIQFANNEIGTIQHIKEIVEEVHRFNGVFHTDAVQAFGHIPIDVQKLDIDMMTASGHKIGTPKGVGFLYKKSSIEINPLIYGTQMDGMRGGTENVPYIIGMAKAVDLICRDTEYNLRLTILRNNFIEQLKSLGCSINGSFKYRLPNNISVTFSQNITGEAMVYGLDTSGIYIGTGSACNSNSMETSYVLKAIGLSNEDAYKTIRITLPDDITIDEINDTVHEISKQIQLLTMEVVL